MGVQSHRKSKPDRLSQGRPLPEPRRALAECTQGEVKRRPTRGVV